MFIERVEDEQEQKLLTNKYEPFKNSQNVGEDGLMDWLYESSSESPFNFKE